MIIIATSTRDVSGCYKEIEDIFRFIYRYHFYILGSKSKNFYCHIGYDRCDTYDRKNKMNFQFTYILVYFHALKCESLIKDNFLIPQKFPYNR